MGKRNVPSNLRATYTVNEQSFGNVQSPASIGTPAGQAGVTYLKQMSETENPNVLYKLTNTYYPVNGDVSDENIEIGMIIDNSGNHVPIRMYVADAENKNIVRIKTYTFTHGSENSISIPMELKSVMKNNTFVHNHPKGTPITLSDITTAASFKTRSLEARLNRENFWNSIIDLNNNKSEISYQLNNLKRQLKDDSVSLKLINQMNDFLNTDLKNYHSMVGGTNRISRRESLSLPYAKYSVSAKTKWPKIKDRDVQDYTVAAKYIFQKIFSETKTDRIAANILAQHALSKEFANRYNLNVELGVNA